jgi:Dihydrodipicolinate synthetase family
MPENANPAGWLAGCIPDLPTPFDETGAVDLAAFARLCERQIKADVPAIVVCETAGEATTLTPEEQDSIIRAAVEVARGRVRVIAGAGSNSTGQAIELTQHAEPAFMRTSGQSPSRPRYPSSCTTFPPGRSANYLTTRSFGWRNRGSSSDCGMEPATSLVFRACGRGCRRDFNCCPATT